MSKFLLREYYALCDGGTCQDLLTEEEAVKEFFIVSELTVSREGTVPAASAEKSTYGKCPRCWRLFPELTEEDSLCKRCEGAVS